MPSILNPYIVALDVSSASQAEQMIQKLSKQCDFYKVGLRLFCAEGPEFVRYLKKKNLKIFLDLKLHDIPNTTAQTVESLLPLKPDFLTLHALGGAKMLEAAVAVANDQIHLLAVTLLTSHEKISDLGFNCTLEEEVQHLADVAVGSGVKGIVCSANDLAWLKLPRDIMRVCPGIRLSDSTLGDQKRVLGPKQALQNGANYLVLGRPVIDAQNPEDAFQKFLEEII